MLILASVYCMYCFFKHALTNNVPVYPFTKDSLNFMQLNKNLTAFITVVPNLPNKCYFWHNKEKVGGLISRAGDFYSLRGGEVNNLWTGNPRPGLETYYVQKKRKIWQKFAWGEKIFYNKKLIKRWCHEIFEFRNLFIMNSFSLTW